MNYVDITQFKYRMAEDEEFKLPADFYSIVHTEEFLSLHHGVLTVKAGYLWDGTSGPTFDTVETMRGGAAHDALYELMRKGIIPQCMKGAVDLYFKGILLEDHMDKLRAWYFHKGVAVFGRSSCKVQPSTKPQVQDTELMLARKYRKR